MTLFGHRSSSRDQHRSGAVDQPPLTSTTTHQYGGNRHPTGSNNSNVDYNNDSGRYAVPPQPFLTTEPVMLNNGNRAGGRNSQVVQSKVYGEEVENVHVSDATDSSDSLRKHQRRSQQQNGGTIDRTHHHQVPINVTDLGPAAVIVNNTQQQQPRQQQPADPRVQYAQPVDKILYGDKYVESSGGGNSGSNHDSDTTLRQKRNVNFAPVVAEQHYVKSTRIPNPIYQQQQQQQQQPPTTIVRTRVIEDQIVNQPQIQVVHQQRWPEYRSPSPELEQIRREEVERLRIERAQQHQRQQQQQQEEERHYSERAYVQQHQQQQQQPKVFVEKRVETTTTTTTNQNGQARNQTSPTLRRRNWQQKLSTSSSSSNSASAPQQGRARSPPPQANVVVQQQKKISNERESHFQSDTERQQQQRTTIPVEYTPNTPPQTVTEYEREIVQDLGQNEQQHAQQQQQQKTVHVERSATNGQFPQNNGREYFRQKIEEIRERHKSGSQPTQPQQQQQQQYASQATKSSVYESPNVTVNGASPAPAQILEMNNTSTNLGGGRYATTSYSAKTYSSAANNNNATTANSDNNADQSMEAMQQRQAAVINNANNLYATIQSRESRSRNRESTVDSGNVQQQNGAAGAAAQTTYYSSYSSSQSAGDQQQEKPPRTGSPQYVQAADLQLIPQSQPAPPPRNSSLNYHAHYRRHHRHRNSRSRSGSRHHTTHTSGDRSLSPLPNGNAVANAAAVEHRSERHRAEKSNSPTQQVVKRTVTTKTKTTREELPAPPAVPIQLQEVQQVNVALSSDDHSQHQQHKIASSSSHYATSTKHVDRSPSTRRSTGAAVVNDQQRVRAGSTTSSTTSSGPMRNGHVSPARQKYEERRQHQRQFEQSISRGGSMQNLANAEQTNFSRPFASYPVQPSPNSSMQSFQQQQEVQYQAPRAGIRPVTNLYRSHSTNGPRDQYYQQRYAQQPLQPRQPQQFVLVQPQSRTASVDRLAPMQQIYAAPASRSEIGGTGAPLETTYHEREDIFIHNGPEHVVHKGWGYGPPYFNKELKHQNRSDDEGHHHAPHDQRHVADEEYDTAPPALYNDGVYSPSADNNRVRRKKSLYRRLSALVKGGGGNNAKNVGENNRVDYYRPTNANAYAPNPQYELVDHQKPPPAPPVPSYAQQQHIVQAQPQQQQTYTTYYAPQVQNQPVANQTWTTVSSKQPSTALVSPTNVRQFETIDPNTGVRHTYVTETLPATTRRKTETEIIYNVPPQPRELLAHAPKSLGRAIPVAPPYPGYTPPISPTHDAYYYVRNDAGNSVLTPTVNTATGQPVLASPPQNQYYYTTMPAPQPQQLQEVQIIQPLSMTTVPQQQVIVTNGHLAPTGAGQQPIYFERRLRREASPGHVMYEVNERRSVSPASGMFLGASAAKSTTYVNPMPPPQQQQQQQQQIVRTETTTTSYPSVNVDHRRPPPAPTSTMTRRTEYVTPQQLQQQQNHHRHHNNHSHQRTTPRGILAQPPHVVQDHYNQRIHREVLTD